MMRRFSQRERRLAAACGILLLAVVLVQGAARPLQQGLRKVNQALSERREVISRAQAAALDLYQIEKEGEAASAYCRGLVICGEAVPEMIRKVGGAAERAGIRQVDIRPLAQEEQGGFFRHRMQLEFRTPFPALKDLLYFLEEGKGPLIVERVEINTEKEGSDWVRAMLVVSAYSMPRGGKR